MPLVWSTEPGSEPGGNRIRIEYNTAELDNWQIVFKHFSDLPMQYARLSINIYGPLTAD